MHTKQVMLDIRYTPSSQPGYPTFLFIYALEQVVEDVLSINT